MKKSLAVRMYRGLRQVLLACVRLLQGFTVFRLLGAWLLNAGTENSNGPGLRHPLHFAGKAVQLCRGTGLEVGSLHRRLPLAANVLYLDMCSMAQLRSQYSEDPRVDQIGRVHLVAKGGSYPFIDDNAFDFVASSHVLEHVANPPRQLQEWLRILRPGGIVYAIVPDMRYCFDRRRSLTTLSHFIEEYERGETRSSLEHYRDYIINTNGEDGIDRDVSEEHIRRCFEAQESIHVHTFTAESLRGFLDHFAGLLGCDLVHFEADELNLHFALKKH